MINRVLFCIASVISFVDTIYAQSHAIDAQVDQYLRLYLYENDKCCEGLISLSRSSKFQEQTDASARGALLRTFCYDEFSDGESIRDIYESVETLKEKRTRGLYRATRARIHTTDNEYLESVQAYHEALELLDPDLDKTLIGLIHLGIGVAHYANDTYPKAYARLHRAYRVFENNRDTLGMIDALDWMANSYARDSMMVQADSVWSAYGQLARQVDNDLIQFYLLQGQGFAHSYEGKHDSSVIYFERAYERSHSLDSGLQTEALVYLLEDTRKAGDDKKTLRYFKAFQSYGSEHKKTKSEARAHYAAARSHASLGEHKAAYSLLMVHDSLDNANWNENTRREIIEYETKYEAAQKDLTIQRSKSQRNLAYLLTAGLLGLVGFFVYRYQKNQKLTSAKIENLENQQKLMALDYILQGQEGERKRIAQDLHDGLGGLLSTVRMKVKSISEQVEELAKIDVMGETEKLVTEACDEVRRISHDMMPASLMSLSLKDALEDLISEREISLDIELRYTGPEALSEKVKVHTYRIIQEIVQNTQKHAQAKQLIIELMVESELKLMTIDDGKGFDYSHEKSAVGIGLKNIESRVNYLGGTCEVASKQGEGTSFRIVIPIDG